jgi:hypothetical protein
MRILSKNIFKVKKYILYKMRNTINIPQGIDKSIFRASTSNDNQTPKKQKVTTDTVKPEELIEQFKVYDKLEEHFSENKFDRNNYKLEIKNATDYIIDFNISLIDDKKHTPNRNRDLFEPTQNTLEEHRFKQLMKSEIGLFECTIDLKDKYIMVEVTFTKQFSSAVYFQGDLLTDDNGNVTQNIVIQL